MRVGSIIRTVPPAPQADSLIGQVVDGRYRIRKVLGRGGMGVVYEAEAIRLGKRLCAIKVLLPEFTRNETVVARFKREAEVAARVKHPNVVEILDTGQTDGGLGYIAMELLVGEGLDRMLERDGPLPWPRAQKILRQICRALAVAHGQGVIHRDVKPENCFRCTVDGDDDFIKVLDFGIAKLADSELDSEAHRLTATNTIVGTNAYLSYEQICGDTIDHRVDIWAAGVLLHELLTGVLPFRGQNQGQIWKAITTTEPAPLQTLAPGLPDGADAVVRKAIAKDRDRRFQTIDSFARALSTVVSDGVQVRSITAKLPAASTGSDSSRDDDPDDCPTQPVIPYALTGLGSDAREPSAHEMSRPSAPTTHPGRHDAPLSSLAARRAGQPPSSGARPLVLLGLGLLIAIAVVSLGYLPRAPEPAAPLAAALAPKGPRQSEQPQPVLPESGSPKFESPKSEQPPSEPPSKRLPTTDLPRRKPVSKPDPEPLPEESYNVRVARELKRLRDSGDTRACFTSFQADDPLEVEVTVTANSGVANVIYPQLKRSSGLVLCLNRVFERWPFPLGEPGDANFNTKRYALNRR